jgi:hypothetical protein
MGPGIVNSAWGASWWLSWGNSWGGFTAEVSLPFYRRSTGGSAAGRFGTDRTRPRRVRIEEDEALLLAGVL